MKHWTLDDIPWDRFQVTRVESHILKVVKAAAMVERNAVDYSIYLGNIFQDDPEFKGHIKQWRDEEEQHGDALGRWAEMADPVFDYPTAFKRFVDGYRIPLDLKESVRGSQTGELIARCIVETGTSSFYSALRDATNEPVLKTICHKIAGDEFRHFKLFYATTKYYLEKENIPAWKRFLIAFDRIRESEDDELAYAYHAANDEPGVSYDRKSSMLNYSARAFSCYRPHHIERATAMIMKSSGLKPQGLIGAMFGKLVWNYMVLRTRRLNEELQKQAA